MGKKANLLKTIGLASALALGGASCNITKNTQKDINGVLNGSHAYLSGDERTIVMTLDNNKKETFEKQYKAYNKLITKLVKEYSASTDGGKYNGEHIVDWSNYDVHNGSREPNEVHGKMKDFYTERFHSMGKKGDSLIGHDAGGGQFFSDRKIFYNEILAGYGTGKYGLIVKRIGENYDKFYKIYDTIEVKDFDEIIKKIEKDLLLQSKYKAYLSKQHSTIKPRGSEITQEEKMLRLLPEHYYDEIKDHTYETYGTLLDKPSAKIMKFADKHGFILKPKLLVLRNIESYEVGFEKGAPIELHGIYIWFPEKKPENSGEYTDIKRDTKNDISPWHYTDMKKDTIIQKDTIPQITAPQLVQQQIQETEKQMNDIFTYGQKVIFKSYENNFADKKVEKGLDKLYDMLQKNPALKIKVTGYYGGTHPTLPLDRAEKVKKYLIYKGINAERIQTEGGKEKFAQSIKIEIVK